MKSEARKTKRIALSNQLLVTFVVRVVVKKN